MEDQGVTVSSDSLEEFEAALDEAQKWAASVGLTETDIDTAIRTVRAKKKA